MQSVSDSIISLEEVLDFALMLEKWAINFYTDARDNALDPACKKFFDWLAVEEDGHYVTFLEMRTRFVGNTPPDCDLPIGYCHFLRLLVKEATGQIAPKSGATLAEAIAEAINLEHRLMDYFDKVKNLFASEDANVIEGILREEGKHMEAIHKYREENMA